MSKSSKQKKDLDFEISFYENILKRTPEFSEALIALGDAYTKKGFYVKGLEVDKKLSILKPEDPIIFYNLACSFSLLRDIEKSLDALQKAVLLGYDDFVYMQKDTDLDNVRSDVRFKEKILKFKPPIAKK